MLVRAGAGAPAAVAAGHSPALDLVDVGPGPYLLLSPHLDDVALSCSALVARLARQARVVVATFFTECGPPPYTLSARAFARQCASDGLPALYAARREEDVAALSDLGVTHVHLGLPDALFRRRYGPELWPAELSAVYPTYRWHISHGKVARRDRPTTDAAAAALRGLVQGLRPGTVLAPMGIGRHVDHVLVSRVAEQHVGDVVYYADLPYSVTDPLDSALVARQDLVPLTWRTGVEDKPGVLSAYATQMDALFPGGGLPDLTECYFAPSSRLRQA